MFQVCDEVVKNSYPKPNKVSAAVLTATGNIYPGVSYHSDVYILTMHAEMVALSHAATHGEKDIIAVTGPNCHACKQLLWENSLNSKTDIIVVLKIGNKFKRVPLSTMMPYAWPAR